MNVRQKVSAIITLVALIGLPQLLWQYGYRALQLTVRGLLTPVLKRRYKDHDNPQLAAQAHLGHHAPWVFNSSELLSLVANTRRAQNHTTA